MFDLGDTVPLTVTIRDAAGAPTNAATVVLTITLPDGTPVTPSITNPPATTGIYLSDYLTVQAGRHTVRWITTTPSTAFTDVFDVRPAAPVDLISLGYAKDHLNITSTTHDEELRSHIAAATGVVTSMCGAFGTETVVETLDGGWEVPLSRWPVDEVTSVVPVVTGGQTVDVADIDVDQAGVARSKSGRCFPYGRYRWTYTAGRAAVPEAVALGTAIIVKHLWETQRGTGAVAFAGGEDLTVVPGVGFAIPRRAVELLQPHAQMAGFA